MSSKRRQENSIVLFRLADVGASLSSAAAGDDEAVAIALDQVTALLDDFYEQPHSHGVTIPFAAEELGISKRTVENWIGRGVLEVVPDTKPREVDVDSLRRVRSAVTWLRERSNDPVLISHVEDVLERVALEKNESFQRALEQYKRGERKPLERTM